MLNEVTSADVSGRPRVTVLIPCRNEEAHIGACLDSVLKCDSGSDTLELEIYVIDGESEDRTREIVENCALRDHRIHLLSNPARIQSTALNIGIRAATGDFLLRVDAHAELSPNYISECLRALATNPSVDVVGGVMVTVPRSCTWIGSVIAEALAAPFGVGRSPFRTGTARPKLVSTVFCGCYRKESVVKVGLYNELLTRGEDVDYHVRLLSSGGRVMLLPSTCVRYHARSQWGWPFVKFYFTEGFWAVYPSAIVGNSYLSLSRLAPCFLVTSLVLSFILGMFSSLSLVLFFVILLLYVFPAVSTALVIGVRRRSVPLIVVLPLVFATMHFPYGTGSIVAFAKRVWSRAKTGINRGAAYESVNHEKL